MAIIARADGAQFCTQSYRELLSLHSPSLLKSELRVLAETNGAFVRLFKQSQGRIEAVFSRDPGYLLGESIWHALGKPPFLIYAEALGPQQILLVVVQQGLVHLDTVITPVELENELQTLRQDPYPYVVKITRGVPIAEQDFAGFLQSFELVEQSYFSELRVQDNMRLLPIAAALQTLPMSAATIWSGLGVLLVILSAIWFWWPSSEVEPLSQVMTPMQQFHASLAVPEIKNQIRALENVILLTHAVPGWEPTKVDTTGDHYTVELHSYAGSAADLISFAKAHRFGLVFSPRGAVLTVHPKLTNRAVPQDVWPSITVVGAIIDRMQETMPGQQTVAVQETHHLPGYVETKVNLNLSKVTLEEVGILREQLAGLPIKLQDAHINVNNGLISGMIRVTVIGS